MDKSQLDEMKKREFDLRKFEYMRRHKQMPSVELQDKMKSDVEKYFKGVNKIYKKDEKNARKYFDNNRLTTENRVMIWEKSREKYDKKMAEKSANKNKKKALAFAGIFASIGLAFGFGPKLLSNGAEVKQPAIETQDTSNNVTPEIDEHIAFTEDLKPVEEQKQVTLNDVRMAIAEEYDKVSGTESNPYEFKFKVSKPQFIYQKEDQSYINDPVGFKQDGIKEIELNKLADKPDRVYMVIYQDKIIYSSGYIKGQDVDVYTTKSFNADGRTSIKADENELTSLKNDKIKASDIHRVIQGEVDKEVKKQQQNEREF